MKIRAILFLYLLLMAMPTGAQEVVINSRVLSVSDGMVGRNSRAVAVDLDDNIWIATDLGVSVFDGLELGVPEGLPKNISCSAATLASS